MIIDVRTAGEFVAGHLPIAVNLPLSEIETNLARRVKDKNQVLLLHCQSGARSGAPRRSSSPSAAPTHSTWALTPAPSASSAANSLCGKAHSARAGPSGLRFVCTWRRRVIQQK